MAVDLNDKIVNVEALCAAYDNLYCGFYVGNDGYVYQKITEEDD